MRLKLLLLIPAFYLITDMAKCQSPNWETYVCYAVDRALTIDGDLNEDAWHQAPWTAPFVDIEGDLKPKPTYLTQAKMLWDKQYFYIAAKMFEPHIWATYDQRDAVIFHENDFEVFIDPDGDTHQYYELEINALGTIWDLLLVKPYRDGGPAINAWDIKGLKKGIGIMGTLNDPSDIDEYWTVELAIPWNVLKETTGQYPKDQDQWRVNFSRVNWKLDHKNGQYLKSVNPQTGKSFPESNWVWSPQGVIAMHQPETWGFVQFSSQTVGTNTVAFVPKQQEHYKWILRQIYYAQHQFFKENRSFTGNIEKLKVPPAVMEVKSQINLHTTPTQFEAIFKSPEGDSWHLLTDGRVRKNM